MSECLVDLSERRDLPTSTTTVTRQTALNLNLPSGSLTVKSRNVLQMKREVAKGGGIKCGEDRLVLMRASTLARLTTCWCRYRHEPVAKKKR